jgi:serine/threonine-protein kinase HipA
MKIDRCPGCLKQGFNSYCFKCKKKLFDGKKVNYILNFSRSEFDKFKTEQSGLFSLPGKQSKNSLKLGNRELLLSCEGGEYIIKTPLNDGFESPEQMPFNEHLTMQIAGQIYSIYTALNALVFFSNGEAAYITKRFDIQSYNNKLLQEDFAQISGKSEEVNGADYKYDYSYEEVAFLMMKYIKAYAVEIEKFFKIILFNYLFSNNDFHLKNISVFRNEKYGDYLLTPFYDLSNTLLHSSAGKQMALSLFKDSTNIEYTRQDFIDFAKRIGINERRLSGLFDSMISRSAEVKELISISFLNEALKLKYMEAYSEKLEKLKN